MKKIILSIITLTVISATAISCKNKEHDHSEHRNVSGEVYTCPMHPEVTSDKPGSCPKCGMDLVKKEADKMEMKPDSKIQGDSTMKM